MAKKTPQEIEQEIEKLVAIKPMVIAVSAFGDDNIAAINAQIMVLKEGLVLGYKRNIRVLLSCPDYVLKAAQTAFYWSQGYLNIASLADDWPLKQDDN